MSNRPSQAKVGRAAELLVEAKCLFNGLKCYAPVSSEERVDLLVGPYAYRCQVKVLGLMSTESTVRYLPLVKCTGRRGARSRFRYSAADIDFMIGVNLDTFAVYVVPIERLARWRRCISEDALVRLGTMDAFHLLKAAPGDAAPIPQPTAIIDQGTPRRRRPSRAWIDRSSLPLGSAFIDGDEDRCRAG